VTGLPQCDKNLSHLSSWPEQSTN